MASHKQLDLLLTFTLFCSYRKLALQFNPQRLENEKSAAVFALVSEAYDVLSNPLRRAVFDQYGEEGLKKGVPGPNDTFFGPYTYHGDPFKTYKYLHKMV